MGKNAKEIKVISSAKAKKNPYKNDIISDDMGQWKYPGLPTRIHSGDITMDGVPYPVLGVDDLGNQQLMLPGMDYTFPGQYVDEFPMARNGGTPKSLKKYTNKNIKTSINDLMRRNETLFGPSGKRRYLPMENGGDPDALYNMKRALELGYQADEEGHWPSVDSENGMWLKSKNHPTAWKEFMYGQLNADLAKNYNVRANTEGPFGENQLQYVPKKQYGGWLNEYDKGGEALPHIDQPYLPAELSSGVDPRTGRKFVYNPHVADFNDLNSTPWKNPRVEQSISAEEPVAAPIDFHPDMVNLLPSESTMVSMDAPDESSIATFRQNKKIAAVKKPQVVTKPVVTKVVTPTKTTLKQDVDLNTFNSPETYDIVVNRQKEDYKKYHRFTQQGSDIMNRTDMGRNKDSEKYIQDLLSNRKDNSVIIDIGSALGNKDSKLAGVSVKELYDNPIINQKAHIIATDIPSEMKVWNAKKDKYTIDVAEVSDKTFNTDVQGILNTKKLNADHVILRAANSIDLIMDANQTVEHFKHLGNTLKDKEVTYVYNNAVLYKPKGSTKFAVKAKLNNAAFDHKSADGKNWVTDKNRKSYTNLSSEKEFYKQKGGQVNWLDEFR